VPTERSKKAISSLQHSLQQALPNQGGIPWGCAYLATLAWIDLLFALNTMQWKSELAEIVLHLAQVIGGVILFVILLNLLNKRVAVYKIASKVWLVIIAYAVSTAAVLLGVLLFIVPGFIFAKWFFYAPYVAATKSVGPLQAMKESKQLSMVNGWKAFSAWTLITFLFGALYAGIKYGIAINPEIASGASQNPLVAFVIYGNEFLSSWVNYVWLTVFGFLMYSEAAQLEPMLEQRVAMQAASKVNLVSSTALEERLKELKILLAKGLIDEDEYKEAKRRELGL